MEKNLNTENIKLEATNIHITNNVFPQGTIYEKELIENFKYFNIFWYDPNDSNDFYYFKNSFQNVSFMRETNLEIVINYFKKETSYEEWIIITPGSKGEELIKNLEDIKCIYAFFIYCGNIELHEKWTKNIKKVKCLTSNPQVLCQKLIEINKDYIFPKFRYNYEDINKSKNDNEIFLWDLEKLNSDNEFALNSAKREIKSTTNYLNKSKNIYNNFCMKTINYLKSDTCYKDYKEAFPDDTKNHNEKLLNAQNDEKFKKWANNIKNLILLSLYFSQYKYLINLLSYKEVKNIYENDFTKENLSKRNEKAFSLIEKLVEKILAKESILELKEELIEIQKYYILFIFFYFIDNKGRNKEIFIKFYQISNFLRDFGFCSIMYNFLTFTILHSKNNNLFEDLYIQIFTDNRIGTFFQFVGKEETKIELSEKNNKIINDALSIKDFLIIGNKQFQEVIKSIENDLKINSIKYLNFEEITVYIREKNIIDNKKRNIRIYFYYIIITLEEFRNNKEKLLMISLEFGITFIILLYIEENSKKNIFIQKNYISNITLISIVLVYSPNDILKYCSNKLNFNFSTELTDFLRPNNIITSSETKIIDEEKEEGYQDGCFELAEGFDDKIVKNKSVFKMYEFLDNTSISDDIYKIYKEHNALDLFFKQNIKYCKYNLDPEMFTLDLCDIKRILYLYCREEKEKKKSFYRMINDDLRTKDPNKIDRFIILLGFIYRSIENKEVASYNGKVYRATKLDENLILKLNPGSTMINTTFWSTTKNFDIAKNFMKKNSWRNAYIICESTKINIDIDYENLNTYNEEEVLILPFTEFKVKYIYSEQQFNKKIYTIKLIELGNKNKVNYENMKVEYINNMGFASSLDQYIKNELSKENK